MMLKVINTHIHDNYKNVMSDLSAEYEARRSLPFLKDLDILCQWTRESPNTIMSEIRHIKILSVHRYTSFAEMINNHISGYRKNSKADLSHETKEEWRNFRFH